MSQPRNPSSAALEALVEAHARELHLPAIRSRFRQLAAEAAREQQTPLAYLAALLQAEVQERSERRERRRLLDARFPLIKRLEEFRFQDNPKVPQATIAALAEGSWIDDREGVILIGESGTGKTHLATALGVCACQQGRRVRFTTLAGLATELQEADSRRELGRVVGRYTRTEVVILDELGYLGLPEGAAELVFQVISERDERGSLICTTNLCQEQLNGPRCSPTRGWLRPSSTGSPTRRTSSTPARSPGASATDSSARRANEHDRPHPKAAHAGIAVQAFALRARPSRRHPRPGIRPCYQATSTTHDNRREVGPLQASVVGPVQTAAPTW